MSSTAFSVSVADRRFEDYVPGTVAEFGSICASEAEIVAYAERFDPQSFHIDPAAAAKGPFGGLIASGWHTCGMMMRLFADHYLSHDASLGSPGVDELRWIKPVRPGEALRLRVTIVDARRSRSKPDRGLVRTYIEMLDSGGDVVMSMTAMNLILARDAG